jgi:Protein of unknown function (DUF4065)
MAKGQMKGNKEAKKPKSGVPAPEAGGDRLTKKCYMDAMLRFQFDERKGLEALVYIASKWPGITAFFASKVLFFAEKRHMNEYARPIVADTFIAMANGPVPRLYMISLRATWRTPATLRRSWRRCLSSARAMQRSPRGERRTKTLCHPAI